jgi:hypothetical protein
MPGSIVRDFREMVSEKNEKPDWSQSMKGCEFQTKQFELKPAEELIYYLMYY